MRRLLRRDSFRVALFTSLTLAITLWPIHFSRFGIRVIMMPVLFSAAFGFFWLGGHAATRRRRLWAYAASGLFLGLTPWTHPTGRLAPLVLIVYVGWLLWRKADERRWGWGSLMGGLTLSGLIAFVIFLPLGMDFVRHPEFFFGHASEVSIFADRVSGGSPLGALLGNLVRVLGMFSFFGDMEWTHGLAGRPVSGYQVCPCGVRPFPAGRSNLHCITAAIGRYARLHPLTCARRCGASIGNEFGRCLQRSIQFSVLVQLIHILQRLDFMKCLQSRCGTTLCWPVAHDGDRGINRQHQSGVITGGQPVMSDHKNVDGADRVVRRHQFAFDIPRQVATAQEAEVAKLKQQTKARCVV